MRQTIYRLLSVIVFLGVFQLCTSSVFAFSGYGSGTSGDPYQIQTCAQLDEMANNLNAFYQEDNDIDCTGVSFTPIGQVGTEFKGTFDGKNFAITNITITGNGTGVGFFGATKNATIQNVRLVSGSVSSSSGSDIGSLIGESVQNTTVTHVSSSLTITPSSGSLVGGLIGFISDSLTVSKCYYSGTIAAGSGANNVAGLTAGINGSDLTTITDCYTSGSYSMNVPGYGSGFIGAYYGSGNATIANSYTSASITLGGNVSYGGLDGGVSQSFTNSFAAATVTGSTTAANGAVLGGGGGTATGVYFDAFLAGTTNCTSGGGSPTCTAENTGNSTPGYFKNNSTSAPMSTWDFTNTWQTTASYPTLRGFTSPAPIIPTPTATPTPPHSSGGPGPTNNTPQQATGCTNQAPTNAPNLFQLQQSGTSVTVYFAPVSGQNNGYYINYGVDSSASGFGTSFNYSNTNGVVSYTINSLFPGTWYFKVRGQNGCMPGSWSGVMSIHVTSLGASATSGTGTVKGTTVLGASTQAVGACTNYTVQSGDTLWGIAASHLGSGGQYSSIMQKNNLSSSLIHTGQILKVGC